MGKSVQGGKLTGFELPFLVFLSGSDRIIYLSYGYILTSSALYPSTVAHLADCALGIDVLISVRSFNMKVAEFLFYSAILAVAVSAYKTCGVDDPPPLLKGISCQCTQGGTEVKDNNCGSSARPVCTKNGNRCKCSKNQPQGSLLGDTFACVSTRKGCAVFHDPESTNLKLGARTQYNLNIHITKDAAANMKFGGMSIVITKGFQSASTLNYNTAWLTIPPKEVLPGMKTFSWTPQYKFGFQSEVKQNQVVESWNGILSTQMETQQSVTYDEDGAWTSPTFDPSIAATALSVEYDPTVWAHTSVWSQEANGDWTPFFVDKVGIAKSTFSGVPQLSARIYLMREIKTSTFIGTVVGNDYAEVSFASSVSEDVCISADNDAVVPRPGPCGP